MQRKSPRPQKYELQTRVQVTARGDLRSAALREQLGAMDAIAKQKRPQVKSVVAATDLSLSLPTKLAVGLGLKDVLCDSVLWNPQFTP